MEGNMDKFIELVRQTVISLFPELAGRYHLGAKAKVTGLATGVQLQPLANDNNPDSATPAVKCDPLPYTLKSGNVVRLLYLYGDPSEPVPVALSTAAIGTYQGGQIEIEGWGQRPAIMADHLLAHSLIGTATSPVDDQGVDLPGAITSSLTRFDLLPRLKDGDQVAALPIEEGDRFIIVAKLGV